MTGFTFTAAMIASVTIATTALLAQQSSPSQDWTELTSRLERAALRGVGRENRTIRTELLRRLTQPSAKADTLLVQYTLAYLGYRMANMPDVTEREQSDLLDDAIDRLQEVLEADPKHAEAHALLGSVYGVQAGRSPLKAMFLGPRASAALDRASNLEGSNPRVVLLEGIGAFNTPAMFGGSVEKAERLLRQSLDLFGREPATKPWPNWGRFDAHVWLGQALVDKGDRAGARAEYDKALAIAPDSGWVRFALMPALEKPVKR